MPAKGPDAYCYNCHHPVSTEDVFCANCGQKHQTGRHSMMKLFSDFFEINFNLNNRLFRTLGGLLIPGFLTEQFFKGRHRKYNSPIQLFFVLAVIFFSLWGWSNEIDTDNDPFGFHERMDKLNLERNQDSILLSIAALTTDEKLKIHVDTSLSYFEREKEEVSIFPDEIDIPIDSTMSERNKEEVLGNIGDFNISIDRDTLRMGRADIPVAEIINDSREEIIQKYFPNAPWYKKIFFRQGLKFGLDQSLLIRFLMTRFPLLLLIVSPLFALVLKFLYVRRPFYFIEHFVFTMHLNTAGILFGLVSFSLVTYCNAPSIVPALALMLWTFYFLFALKRFYGQSWRKTFLKFILANTLGMFAAGIALVIIMGIAFLFF